MDSPPYDTRTQKTPQLPLRHHFATGSPVMSHLISGQTQLDEGFSEETRSQSDSEMMFSAVDMTDIDANTQKVLQQIMALPAEQRECRCPLFVSHDPVRLISLLRSRIRMHQLGQQPRKGAPRSTDCRADSFRPGALPPERGLPSDLLISLARRSSLRLRHLSRLAHPIPGRKAMAQLLCKRRLGAGQGEDGGV